MPILAVLDEGAHGALDDSLKTLYVQNTEDKKFYLDIAPDEAAKVAFNLQRQFEAKKTDLSRVHGEKTALTQKLKTFEDLGKSADELKVAIESGRPEEVTKLVEKYEAEKEQLRKSFEEPLAAARDEVKELLEQVGSGVVNTEITRLIADHKLDPELAPDKLRNYIKAVPEEEGSRVYVARVFENGQPALKAGQPMGSDDLLASWREGKKNLGMFKGGDGGGGGSSGRQSQVVHGSKTMKRDDYFKLAPTEQSKFIAEGGKPID